MMKLLLLLAIVGSVMVVVAQAAREGYSIHNLSAYTNATSLSNSYHMYWAGDETWIHLAFVVKTTGWFGFGLAEPTSGSMPGADILLAWVDDATGEPKVQDRWAHGKMKPNLDTCSSWLLDDGFQNATHTHIAVTRLRDTNDESDRTIPDGLVKIIYAFSDQNSDVFKYHGSMRHASAVTFFRDLEKESYFEIDPEWEYVDLLMDDFVVPKNQSIYGCQSFNLTFPSDRHIVRISPLVNPDTKVMVHHFLLHLCSSSGVWPNYQDPKSCISPLNPRAKTGCVSPIFGWGIGGGPLYLPPEAGYRLSTTGNGMQYFILEVHYDSPNPNLPAFRTDRSGVRIHYTSNLRQHDASMMVLADPFVSASDLIPDTMTHIQATCQSGCTSHWEHDINVFADFLHMHSLGHRMWSTVHRDGVQLPGYLNRIEYYDFSFQELGPIVPYYKLKPGDRIETHCVFDSSGRTSNTTFGSRSEDEMCTEFIAYYPALTDSRNGAPFALCGYAEAPNLRAVGGGGIVLNGNVSICGSVNNSALQQYAQSVTYELLADTIGAEESVFGIPNLNGWCPDPISGKLMVPPTQDPDASPSYRKDLHLIIWPTVIGSLLLIAAVAGIWVQCKRTNKNVSSSPHNDL